MSANLRKVMTNVAFLNLAYFGIEFAVALRIGSVSLFAGSVDFLEDASVNVLIAVALGWNATNRARLGMALAGILLVPGLATLWTAWQKVHSPLPPATFPSVIGWRWCSGNQSVMCPDASAVSHP
jgi:Co/Zn/Cd efflux system component